MRLSLCRNFAPGPISDQIKRTKHKIRRRTARMMSRITPTVLKYRLRFPWLQLLLICAPEYIFDIRAPGFPDHLFPSWRLPYPRLPYSLRRKTYDKQILLIVKLLLQKSTMENVQLIIRLRQCNNIDGKLPGIRPQLPFHFFRIADAFADITNVCRTSLCLSLSFRSRLRHCTAAA